jgi:hypothetical protein
MVPPYSRRDVRPGRITSRPVFISLILWFLWLTVFISSGFPAAFRFLRDGVRLPSAAVFRIPKAAFFRLIRRIFRVSRGGVFPPVPTDCPRFPRPHSPACHAGFSLRLFLFSFRRSARRLEQARLI